MDSQQMNLQPKLILFICQRQNILTYIFWLFGGNSTHSCNHGSSQFPKIKLFPLKEIISVMRDNVLTQTKYCQC